MMKYIIGRFDLIFISFYCHVMHIECPALMGLQETNTTVAAVKQFMTFNYKITNYFATLS